MAIDSQRNSRPLRTSVTEPALVGAGTQMRTASLPAIMLTAHHGESEEKALDLGAQDCLTNPVQSWPLVARIRAVLKRVTS